MTIDGHAMLDMHWINRPRTAIPNNRMHWKFQNFKDTDDDMH